MVGGSFRGKKRILKTLRLLWFKMSLRPKVEIQSQMNTWWEKALGVEVCLVCSVCTAVGPNLGSGLLLWVS